MSRPTLRGDLEFIKSEILLGINWLRKYFKDKSDDNKKARIVSMIEFGPFNGLRLLVAVIITLVCLFSFSLYRSETTFWVLVFIFLFSYDFFLGKGWMVPWVKKLGSLMYSMVTTLGLEMIAFIKSVLMGTKDMILDMFSIKKKD